MPKKCKTGYYYCYTDKKCKKIPMGWHVGSGCVDVEFDGFGRMGCMLVLVQQVVVVVLILNLMALIGWV